MGGHQATKINRPTEEEIAAAIASDEERCRGLDAVEAELRRKYLGVGLFREIFVMAGRAGFITVLAFYHTEDQRLSQSSSTIAENFEADFWSLLSHSEYPFKAGADVLFVYDSHEVVVRDFEGDYFLRLR